MTLKKLIQNNSWLSIKITLINLYADQEKLIDGYEMIYSKLQM